MKRASAELGGAAVRLLAEDAKLALLATVDDNALPHLTLLTSLQAKSPTQLMFGQFCEGRSKDNLAKNPRAGFLALDRERQWVRGTATWCGSAKQGEDYEAFNRKPMFRYNAYFGIHTVHYLDVVEADAPRRLATAPLVAGALQAKLAAAVLPRGRAKSALSPWSRELIGRPTALKFLAFVDKDGYPRIVPSMAAAIRTRRRVVLAPPMRDRSLSLLRKGLPVALFAIDLEMRSVLVRGVFHGWNGVPGLRFASIDVDWAYNTMPPQQGQIFPPVPLMPVRFAAEGR